MRLFFGVFGYLFLTSACFAAEISGGKFRAAGVASYINIIGPIKKGDAERFKQLVLAQIKNGLRVAMVRTYGPGGDVQEAIDIGRQIRTMRAETQAPIRLKQDAIDIKPGVNWCPFGNAYQNWAKYMAWGTVLREGDPRCECASACFLIWAGGIGRWGTVLGVHRPAFVDQAWFGSLSMDKAQVAYEQIMIEGARYLAEMDIPDPVIQTMLSVSSAQVLYLEESQIVRLANYPQFVVEVFLARCGRAPKSTSPEFQKWVDCYAANEKAAEFYRGAEAYWGRYGK